MPVIVPVAAVSDESPAESAEFLGASKRLTLKDAIRIALERNPDLVAVRHNEMVSRAALEVARTYPYNPVAQLQLVPSPRGENGDTQKAATQFVVQQTFELMHQSRYREHAGVAQLDRTQWNIAQSERLNIAETERRFFAALYQRRLRDLAVSAATLNEKLLGVLGRRFAAGLATATDVTLARIEARSTRQQADLAEGNYAAALADLRSQLGLERTASIELVGDLEKRRWAPITAAFPRTGPKTPQPDAESDAVSDSQWEQLMAGRPDVMAAHAAVQTAKAQHDLAWASRVPNVILGPFYERDETATQFWGIAAQVSLPVINTGNPLVRQRRAELHQNQIALDQLKVKVRLEIQAAVERYERARRVAGKSRSDVDGLSKEIAQIEKLFDAGQVDLLRVFTARSSVLQVRRNYVDILNELAQSAAELTRVTGMDPHFLLSPDTNRQE